MSPESQPPINRQAYARWYYLVWEACDEYDRQERHGEDLQDFVDMVRTMLSFGPNPRMFDPPIMPVSHD